jgi:[NiFe] hydrogenase assembly HybE family chaperone
MTETLKSPPTPLFQRGENPASHLEATFRQIAATRMAGVGLLNPALEVEAIGFRPLGDDWLGVLITPWFMNLICMPGAAADGEAPSSGTRQDMDLPSGSYEFLTAHEDELGPYLTSSLFSPMSDFTDMDQARQVATEALAELFTPAASPPPAPEAPPAEPVGLIAKLERPVSRRGFLSALLGPARRP